MKLCRLRWLWSSGAIPRWKAAPSEKQANDNSLYRIH